MPADSLLLEHLGSSLRSPAEGEGHEGFPPPPDKDLECNAGDLALIPGLGRSPGVGNGNPLQYSCLENSMDKGAWQATVHGAAKSHPTHVARLEFPRETGLILRCAGKAGNPFQTTQGNRPSCRHQEGRRGSAEAVLGTTMFSLRQTQRSPEGPRHLHRIPRLSEASSTRH